jgi:hypothetical protein
MVRVTRWVREKIAQNVAQPDFSQTLYTTFSEEKSRPKHFGTLCNFQSKLAKKLLPKGWKFAQSDRPALAAPSNADQRILSTGRRIILIEIDCKSAQSNYSL